MRNILEKKRVEMKCVLKMHSSEEAMNEDAVGLHTKTRKHLQPVYPAIFAKEGGIKQLVAVLVITNTEKQSDLYVNFRNMSQLFRSSSPGT